MTDDGERFGATLWSDLVTLEGARAVAEYADNAYPEGAAITEHGFGRGRAVYAGTMPDPDGMRWLVRRAASLAALPAEPALPSGVELVRRRLDGRSWLFVLNHTGEPTEVPLERPARDLLTGTDWEAVASVGPYDVAILRIDD